MANDVNQNLAPTSKVTRKNKKKRKIQGFACIKSWTCLSCSSFYSLNPLHSFPLPSCFLPFPRARCAVVQQRQWLMMMCLYDVSRDCTCKAGRWVSCMYVCRFTGIRNSSSSRLGTQVRKKKKKLNLMLFSSSLRNCIQKRLIDPEKIRIWHLV